MTAGWIIFLFGLLAIGAAAAGAFGWGWAVGLKRALEISQGQRTPPSELQAGQGKQTQLRGL